MNNRGFAVSTALYGILIMGLLLSVLVMSIASVNRKNTRDLTDSIDRDLNQYSRTSAEFNVYEENGSSYVVPDGQSGWYKIELFGHKEYTSTTIFLSGNQWLYFYVAKDATRPHTFVSNEKGSYVSIESQSKYIFSSNGSKVQGNKYINDYNAVNILNLSNSNNGYNQTGYLKAKINKISEEKRLETTNGKSTTIPTGIYYIFRAKSNASNDNRLSPQVLTVRNGGNDVAFREFAGALNQKWLITQTESVGGKQLYNIKNNEYALLRPEQNTPTDGGKLITTDDSYYGVGSNPEKTWELKNVDQSGVYGVWNILTYQKIDAYPDYTPALVYTGNTNNCQIRNVTGQSYKTVEDGESVKVVPDGPVKHNITRLILVPAGY